MFNRFCVVLVVFHHLITILLLGKLLYRPSGYGFQYFYFYQTLGFSLGALIVICALQFVITGQWKPYALFKCNNNVTGK